MSSVENKLRIATYNVKNLYNDRDLRKLEESVPNIRLSVRPKPRKETRALARVIRESEAQILALQECSSLQGLREFLERNSLSEKFPFAALEPGNSLRGIQVAVLSRFPIERVISHSNLAFHLNDQAKTQTKFSRDLLQVEIATEQHPGWQGQTVAIFVAHLKSKRPSNLREPLRKSGRSDPFEKGETLSGTYSAVSGLPDQENSSEQQRQAEARCIRSLIDNYQLQHPERLVLLAGDMNDLPTSPTLEILRREPRGWSDVLEHLEAENRRTWPSRSGGQPPFGVPGGQFDYILFRPNQAFSLESSKIHYLPDSSNLASDHLLVSADFVAEPREQGQD